MRGYYGRNYGRGFGPGAGPGYGPGYGRGWCHDWPDELKTPEGYSYLGPCRCGFGPHAFWQEKETGRIFRGFPGYGGWFRPGYPWPGRKPSEEDLKSELDWLKQAREDLEARIKDLEETLKKEEK
ncbi:MAG: hypothetical protein ACPLRR_10395 [Candidatus Saccharicenans sp.]